MSQHLSMRWPRVASELGFEFEHALLPDASQRAVRNGSALERDGSWLALSQREPTAGDPLRDLMGAPGLWRGLRDPAGDATRFVRAFGLPPVATTEAETKVAGSGRGSEIAWRELLKWADLTADGAVPSDWVAPSSDELEPWATPGRLRVRAGAYAAEGLLQCQPDRLALSIPSLVRIAPGLAPARIAWIRELCHHAHSKWRMVRLGFDAGDSSVAAEVDLTGAPSACLPILLELAHSALVSAGAWVLPILAVAADPTIDSALLDRHPRRDVAHPARRSRQAPHRVPPSIEAQRTQPPP